MNRQTLKQSRMAQTIKAIVLVALTLLFGTTTTNAQLAATYTSRFWGANDVKGYSVAVATDGTYNERLMVGTIFDVGAKHLLHFQRVDDSGAVLNSIYYDNSAYREIRPVAIIGNGRFSHATYYIVAMGRPITGYDRVMIIPIDKYGAVTGVGVKTFYPNGSSLYPLHAIMHSNGFLYICGVSRNSATSAPVQPGYNGLNTNTGFVIKVNPVSGTFMAGQTINTAYPAGPYSVDFDMATRVYELFDHGLSGNVGQIFVTGSVNNVRGTLASPIACMATMNVKLDPNLTSCSLNHFSMGPAGSLPTNEYLNDEIGMGIEYDPWHGGYVVMSNLVERVTQYIPASQFNAFPKFPVATYVDKDFKLPTIPTARPRIRFQGFEYSWVNQTLKSSLGICDWNTHGATLRIAGMQMWDYWCINPSVHTFDNVGPFLWHTEMEYDPGSGNLMMYKFGKWTTYYTETGTGRESTSPVSNNYWRKGGGLSNPALLPAFACKVDTPGLDGAGMTSLVMPAWNTSNGGRLNNKSVLTIGYDAWGLSIPRYTNDFQTDPLCVASNSWSTSGVAPYMTPAPTCINAGMFPSLQASPVTAVTSESNSFGSVITNGVVLTTTLYTVTGDVCRIPYNPHYRGENTGVATVESTGTTSFYPNPTAGSVQVSLAQDIAGDANLKIVLVNVQGQVAAQLYEGSASQLRANVKLNLPNLPAGVYMATLVANGKLVHQQKLTILP